QHHAVWFQNVAAELAQIFFIKAHNIKHQVAELLAHRLFIEHAEHSIFAVDGWHDGDAEIDQPAAVLDAETAVLRHAAFRNIQLAHDLDAGNDGGVMFLGHRLHGQSQHAVNAILYDYRIAFRLNVNVTGALLQR